MQISLHHLSLTDVSHRELSDIAGDLGCDHVCLFVKVPGHPSTTFPRVQNVRAARELRSHLEFRGMSVWNVDTFMVEPGVDIQAYRETLEIAAALGAKTVNALNLHPGPELAAAAKILAAFSDRAADHGLAVILEWFRFSHTKTLGSALELISLANRPNLKLNVDILHLMRNGGHPADLAAVDPSLMNYAQICDGPLHQPLDEQMTEAVAERNVPGGGDFPLTDFVRRLPSDGVLSIEAPVNRLRASLNARQFAGRLVGGTRRILCAAGR
jgi:sugar phosphate isomerase/epimerase